MKPSLESDENSLILRRRAPWNAPAVPHGIAVVGDIHGRLDRLDRVLSRLPQERALVFLGDYVDRGPESRGVIERLIGLERRRRCVLICGHTPYRSPLQGPDWINIDTGCGKLAAASLTALLLPELEIIQG